MQGPDEVHIQQIGKTELKRAKALTERAEKFKEVETSIAARWNTKL